MGVTTFTIGWWITLLTLFIVCLIAERGKRRCYYYLLDKYMASTLPSEVAVLDQRRVDAGFKAMKEMKVVITGLIRNGAKHISRIRKQTEQLGSHFQDYRILIVENDSTDNTRQQLLAWHDANLRVDVLGCGVNVNECIMKLPKTVDHEADRPRIVKMANLRNIYLDHVMNEYSSFDYLIVIDLDLVGTCYIDGIASSFVLSKTTPKSMLSARMVDDYMLIL